jgi:DNA-binding NarL/FixJ family response regulator
MYAMPTHRFHAVVADDGEDMRELIVAALEMSGSFTVVGRAADGAEAISEVKRTQPDLAIVDLAMPVVTGLEAIEGIRAVSPSTKVVVVSGFPRGRLAEMVAAKGATAYVEKGLSARRMVNEIISVAGVLEVVEGVLDQRRTQLAADVRSSAGARRFMEETLRRWECGEVLDIVNILVSELVTNAIKHAHSEADVMVLLTSTAIRIEVTDTGEGVPQPKELVQEGTSGRGLAIVDVMSSAWGVVPHEHGKTVWFEVPRLDQAELSSADSTR